MPAIDFGTSSYERTRGDLPELPVVNFTIEEAPTEERGFALQSRPGVTDRSADMGTGPVEVLFKQDGVLSGALFGISAGALYSGTTNLGTIDGTGHASLAGYETFLFANAGASLYGYDGTTLSAIAFPDSASVLKVIVAASRAVAIRKDTQKYYFSDVLGSTFAGLGFTSAESQPDRLLDMLFIDGVLVLFGTETTELHALTGDADLPFSPVQGRVIERGVKATGCATAIGSTFAWVTNLNEVCVQDENNIISNPGLQAAIEASAVVHLFTFVLDGVEYLALRLDTETHVWGMRGRAWSRFESHGQTNWIPQCYAGGVFGSGIDGRTLEWGTGHLDLGGVMSRRWRAGMPINSGGQVIGNMSLRTNVGQTSYLSGTYADPQVEMRLSRDAGQTWGSWRGTRLGGQGQYRTKPTWRACGQASYPALFAEFRVTDPVDVRVSNVLVNEAWGGR